MAPPSHRSASPRATSTSGRRRRNARRPASFAAAVSTPPRTGYYAPLVAATPRDDDNPFAIDSGPDDDDSAEGGSPLLLTDPAGADGAPANATAVLAAIAGASEDSGTRSGDSGDPSPLAAPGTAAAILADFAILLEKHVSALNDRIDTLHAETASNHGHITKRLFPAFDERFTNLEKALATSTEALEAKGASLLAKCTALEDRVSSIVDGLPTASESTTAPPQARSGPREPPDDSPPPPRFRPGPSNTPVHAGSNYVRRGERVDAGDGVDVVGGAATTTPPPDTPLDVNARTRTAYATARAMNAASRSPRETATRRGNSPVRNPYLPRTTPRQILRAYVEELDITVAGLDDEMEWETWEDGDFDAPTDE